MSRQAQRIRQYVQRFKSELSVYRRVLVDPRTPRSARWLLGLALAYLVTPVDLIPDFIPVLGQLDDLLVVPLLVWLAVRLIPRDIVEEHRRAVGAGSNAPGQPPPPA